MTEEPSSKEAIERLRSDRREGYLRIAESVDAGDVGPAEGLLSVAESFLELDVEATEGALLFSGEPLTVDVTEPTGLEDPDLLACWSDLLELIERDPVIERGPTDA